MARKFGANCSKCQRSTEQQQSIKCFKIHGKDLLQNNDFHITSSIFLLSSVLVFYFFLILFFNSIVYRFFIARIFGVLPEYFRDWGGCRPPRPPGSYAYARDGFCVNNHDYFFFKGNKGRCKESTMRVVNLINHTCFQNYRANKVLA